MVEKKWNASIIYTHAKYKIQVSGYACIFHLVEVIQVSGYTGIVHLVEVIHEIQMHKFVCKWNAK